MRFLLSSILLFLLSHAPVALAFESTKRCTDVDSNGHVTIEDGATSIAKDAFRGCTSLTSITMPDSVTSIGDYVLSGGETAALTVMDAVIRLLPGVIGKEAGHLEESFETGLLEHSHYTQPRLWNGIEAPDILASGHHRRIAEWRQAEAEKETQIRRPDMWQRYEARQKLHKGKA